MYHSVRRHEALWVSYYWFCQGAMGHFHLQGFTPRKSAATQQGDAIYPFIVEVSIAQWRERLFPFLGSHGTWNLRYEPFWCALWEPRCCKASHGKAWHPLHISTRHEGQVLTFVLIVCKSNKSPNALNEPAGFKTFLEGFWFLLHVSTSRLCLWGISSGPNCQRQSRSKTALSGCSWQLGEDFRQVILERSQCFDALCQDDFGNGITVISTRLEVMS